MNISVTIITAMRVMVFMFSVLCFAETYVPEPGNRVTINLGASPWKFIKSDKIYQACWTPFSIKPVVNLAHHWNRSGNVTVNAFSNCDSVRLLINNVSQGVRKPNPLTGNMPCQCSQRVG